MTLEKVLLKRKIHQQCENWFVLDDKCVWNIEVLRPTVIDIIGKEMDIPVIFCDINESKDIINELGGEEDEYLRFASGLYERDVQMVFIYQWGELLSFVETILHELRHVMQDEDIDFRHHFESDKKLSYNDRITEIDAFNYAKDKIDEWIRIHQATYKSIMNLN